MKPFALLCSCVLLALPLWIRAMPIVSVDVDPGTAGIQASLLVALDSDFSVDVVVEGVESSQPLQAFEFDLGFLPALVTALSVVDGGFLQGPFGTFISEQDVSPPDVDFGMGAVGISTTFGSGVLASIVFHADAAGTGGLDLNNVLLAAFPSTPIPLGGVNNGSITVQGQSGGVPVPGTMVLFGIGTLLLGWTGRRVPRITT